MDSNEQPQKNHLLTAVKGAKAQLRDNWLPDITMTIIGASFGGAVGYLMSSYKGMVYGAAVGLTTAIWVFAYLMVRNLPTTEQSEAQTAQTTKQEPAPTPEKTSKTPPPSESAVPELPKPKPVSATPVAPPVRFAISKQIPTGKELQMNKDHSTPAPISQTMTNSPGGIQNIGGQVTINHAPPSRSFTAEQQNVLLTQLAKWPPMNFQIVATTGDSEIQIFSEEIKRLLVQAGWTLKTSGQFFPTGDRPVGVIMQVKDPATAASAAIFQQGLESFGYKAPGLIDTSLADNTVHIIVGHRK